MIFLGFSIKPLNNNIIITHVNIVISGIEEFVNTWNETKIKYICMIFIRVNYPIKWITGCSAVR